MLKDPEETQIAINKFQSQNVKIYNKSVSVNNGLENITPQDVRNSLIRQKINSIEGDKRKNNKLQPLKDSTNVKNSENDLNIIKIKPKNRTSSVVGDDKTSQNSTHPINQPVALTKTKKPIHSKKILQCPPQYKTSKIILNPQQFLLKPIQSDQVTKCTVNRESTLFKNDLIINLKGSSNQIIAYERIFKLFGSKMLLKLPQKNQILSVNQSEEISQKVCNPNLGWMQSNFDGSLFDVYEGSQEEKTGQIIATIQYCGNALKFGDPRKIKIFIKDRSIPNVIQNVEKYKNLKQFFEQEGPTPAVQCLTSLSCQYDQQRDAFGLSFGAEKEIKPSVHNMILADDSKKAVLKFFKTEEKLYELWCYNPLSPLVGCAFALSSFIFKLVSQ